MPDQEQNAEQSSEQNAQQEAPHEENQQGDPAALGDAGKKALDAERKRASDAEKQAKALQAQLDALNDSKLTETERLQKQLSELRENYEKAQLTAARDRVAVAEQVPAQLVPYLTGSDESELADSARALMTALAEAAKPGTPKPDPSQGAHGQPAAPSNADQFATFIERSLKS